MRNDFLLEIGCEELPPKALKTLVTALSDGIQQGLQKASLQFGQVKTYAAPRRLAVQISELEQAQEDTVQTRKGPSVKAAFDANGKPTAAAQGFAKSCGVEVEQLKTIKEGKGEWLAFDSIHQGESATALLPEIVNNAIKKLPIPKPMRWGNYDVQFVRPVHWLLMMMGSDVIEAEILGKKTSNQTHGHRFHHPQAMTLEHVSDYAKVLQSAYVIADFDERKQRIQQQIAECAKACDGKVVENDALLDEVTAIVEWPKAVLIDFDEQFLEIPKEALMESMASHQKCFSIESATGELLAKFITVANIDSEQPSQVIKGNEKVMRARLSDAAFFFDKDKQSSLADKSQSLSNIVFQKKLGSVQDKVNRVIKLASSIGQQLGANISEVERAASLCKASLVTEMVGEFPSLQDVMGYYYAMHDGESEAVALALKEYYLPRFSGDVLPQSVVGTALALADRLDTLVGIFGIGQKPTGVKDPFQLRRAALGIIRILIEGNHPLLINSLLDAAVAGYQVPLENQDVVSDLQLFIYDRLYHYLTSALSARADVAKAVLVDLTLPMSELVKRADALQPFVESSEAQELIQGFKRVSNILKSAEKLEATAPDEQLFKEDAERQLYSAIINQTSLLEQNLANKNYQAALQSLAKLKAPVDAFFDEVMVNVDELALKQNRLKMLMLLQQLFLQFADLSLIQQGA